MIQKYVLPGLPKHYLDAAKIDAADAGSEDMRQAMMDFVVDHRFINGEHAMVINTDRCVGCDDCVRACATAQPITTGVGWLVVSCVLVLSEARCVCTSTVF